MRNLERRNKRRHQQRAGVSRNPIRQRDQPAADRPGAIRAHFTTDIMIKNKLIEWLNAVGLYTARQYLEQVERKSAFQNYAVELEKALRGMSDPSKPIVAFSDYTVIRNVSLQYGQQIITSPSARAVIVEGVYCSPRADANKEGGAA